MRLAQSVRFMYQVPPGFDAAQEREKLRRQQRSREDGGDADDRDAPELSLFAQRESRPQRQEEDGAEEEEQGVERVAPRAGRFTEALETVRDKPFGKEWTRTMKCHACGVRGHIHTDRECARYGQLKGDGEASRPAFMDPLQLMVDMRKSHGLTLKATALGQRVVDPRMANQQLVDEEEEERRVSESDSESESEDAAERVRTGERTGNGLVRAMRLAVQSGMSDMAFIRSLSTAEKRRLFRKLDEQMGREPNESDERGRASKRDAKQKKSKKSKKKKKRTREEEERDEQHQRDEEEDERRRHKKKKRESTTTSEGHTDWHSHSGAPESRRSRYNYYKESTERHKDRDV